MSTRVWNKLVRDRIPEIIRADGKEPTTRVLSDEEFDRELRAKLVEEATEALAATCSDELAVELADVLEVVQALAEMAGIPFGEIERLRRERADTRGGFSSRLYLFEARDPGDDS
jgi:predicted house-cleaning noncanonical NTP pyrophosphatase (MazG superfamily)